MIELLHKYSKGLFVLCVGVLLGLFVLLQTDVLAKESDRTFDLLKKRLVEDGLDNTMVEKLYAQRGVYFDTKSASLFFLHKEAKLNYDQFATQSSISKAKKYMKDHKVELEDAEKTYGVDKKIITAILLVETQLGTLLGKRSVLNTLSTLAALADKRARDRLWNAVPKTNRPKRKNFEQWSKKKSTWAYRELKAFFEYTIREDFNPVEITGSYAGALGIAQFMPTSILDYAKDGNWDGNINLFDHADAIASVASYLKRNGWHPNIETRKARKVLYTYNHSNYYVKAILKISRLLKG
jgi:membrane-bound lytic murein transglycosylase B